MTSALLAAVLLVCAAAATRDLRVAAVGPEEADSDDGDVEDDGEGDFAPFMIVVEHPDGWRCAGSLVSLRTALTSAWCARGRGAAPARELWALAAAAAAAAGRAAPAARVHGARRVARVAVATGADAEVRSVTDGAPMSWRGGAMDLAVLELEEPFGGAAHAQPILMATAPAECAAAGAQCHVSRAGAGGGGGGGGGAGGGRGPGVAGARLAPAERCARAANFWNTVRDRALCFVGPELCASDWGGSLVCGGKLCGVVSRSVRASGGEGDRVDGGGGGGDGGGDQCGDTHAAQSLAQWRRFLHCAHTLRACGSGGPCEDLCVERRLLDEPPAAPDTSLAAPDSSPAAPDTSPATDGASKRPTVTTVSSVLNYPSRTSKPQGRPDPTPTRESKSSPARISPALVHAKPQNAPPAPPTPAAGRTPRPAVTVTAETPASLRPSFEFEPNRPDFKAGEYGDNAADYGGEEPAPAPPTRTAARVGVYARTRAPDALPPSATPPTPPTSPPPRAGPALVAFKPPPTQLHARKSSRAPSFLLSIHPLLMFVPFIYIFMVIY